MTSAPDLAGRFHQRWLEQNPFAATSYGIPGYDHLVPDESEAGEQAWRAEVGRFLAEAGPIEPGTPAEEVTLGCTRQAAAGELDGLDMARSEHTVTAMQFAGPATFLAVAARTVLVDPDAAEAYLTGKLEILRIRDDARRRLGPAFELPAFHAAVLDHGSLPMPVLARSIEDWLSLAAPDWRVRGG